MCAGRRKKTRKMKSVKKKTLIRRNLAQTGRFTRGKVYVPAKKAQQMSVFSGKKEMVLFLWEGSRETI